MDKKVFDLIERIANEHSRGLKGRPFGYLDQNDLKNEIWAICLDKYKEYDISKGPIENFLRVIVKNRLINRFKDITKSIRSPCGRCEFYDPGKSPSDCKKFGDERQFCNKWHNYQLSTESRNSLLNAVEPPSERTTSHDIIDILSAQEIKELIRGKVEDKYKRDLQLLLSGGKISKQKLKKLKMEIMRILNQVKEIIPLTIGATNANTNKK